MTSHPFWSRLALGLLVASGCRVDTTERAGPSGTSVPVPVVEPASAKGTFTIQRQGEAEVRLDVDGCWSGQALLFYGADLFHDPDFSKRVRVVEDAVLGKRVVLIGLVPDHERLVIEPKSCSTFELRIEQGSLSALNTRRLKGVLKLECSLPEGRVSATIEMNDCAFDRRTIGL